MPEVEEVIEYAKKIEKDNDRSRGHVFAVSSKNPDVPPIRKYGWVNKVPFEGEPISEPVNGDKLVICLINFSMEIINFKYSINCKKKKLLLEHQEYEHEVTNEGDTLYPIGTGGEVDVENFRILINPENNGIQENIDFKCVEDFNPPINSEARLSFIWNS